MSAESAIKACFDRLAKGREAESAVWTGNDFWTKIDAAADETFENRVKGSDITALDTLNEAGASWGSTGRRKFFELLNSYFNNDLALATPYLTSYLATVGWRVPYGVAEAMHEATNVRLAAQYVFGKGTRPADEANPATSGMHKFSQWIDTGGGETHPVADGALVNCLSPAVAISQTATPSGSAHAATITLSDATTKNVTFTPDATQYGHILIGQQAIGAAAAAAGQKVIPVAATGQFKAATYVLVVKADFSVQELVLIDSLVANTSLTATANLINSWAENDLVLPLCSNCIWQAGTISNDKTIDFYAWPDRIIAL